MPADLPNAVAIVHPHNYPGSNYPFPDLSGVGVAFKVAWALTGEFPVEELDLVAIGEIADVVNVTDENHALISWHSAITAGDAPRISGFNEIS